MPSRYAMPARRRISPACLPFPASAHVSVVRRGHRKSNSSSPDMNNWQHTNTLCKLSDSASGARNTGRKVQRSLAAQRVLLKSPTSRPGLAAIGQRLSLDIATARRVRLR